MESGSDSSSPDSEASIHHNQKLTTAEELQRLYDYRPPRFQGDPESSSSPLIPPLSFYDKHLDKSLVLKRVCLSPALLRDIPDTVSSVFESMKANAIRPSYNGFTTAFFREHNASSIGPITNADFLADVLGRTTADYCLSLACTLILSPHRIKWTPVLSWSKGERGKESWVHDSVKACIKVDDSTLCDLTDGPLRDSVSQVLDRFPEVVIWMVNSVSDEAESLLKLMDKVASARSFKSQICLTKGCLGRPFAIEDIFDARKSSWNIPAKSTRPLTSSDGPWRNTRARNARLSSEAPKPIGRRTNSSARTGQSARRIAGNQRHQSLPVVYPPSRKQTEKCREELDGDALPEHLLQHAWAEAVRQESTVIVFNCGNYERIGIRHRTTQTLYLSQLIKTYRCKDPPYGKLHIGLYMAAFEDAVDRAAQQCETGTIKGGRTNMSSHHVPLNFKRSLPDDGPAHRTRKRRKLHTARPFSDRNSFILKEACNRQLALFHLRYGVYNSPAPASFIRHNGTSSTRHHYQPDEYITIVVDSYLGHGATGTLHGGKMELRTSDGQQIVYDVAVKLALNDAERTRLQHEYDIYVHMVAANVTGIMNIIGLFEDMEGYTLALVMSYGGISLWDREIREGNEVTHRATTVTPSERAAFILTLESIHSAGVRHRDIRPANLVVHDDTGEVAIIDFDRAHLDISEDEMRYETDKLVAVLDGQLIDEEISPSPLAFIHTNESSVSESE